MSDKTEIEWTDATWNPIRGCSRVSEGCRNCYAERVAARFSGPGMPYEGLATIGKNGPRWTGEVRMVPEHLTDPLRWRKPRRIFVNSMSDLFHEKLADDDIDQVFGAMWACLYGGPAANPHDGHTFQILTKRAARMRDYMSQDRRLRVARSAGAMSEDGDHINDQTAFFKGPHPRIWLGVSVEDQATADERIPHLLATPAAVRFLSVEPMLGPIQFGRVPGFNRMGLDLSNWWVICGGESGPGARTMDVGWALSMRDQCRAAGVPFFFKQWGGVNKKAAGRELDGRTWDEMPRVQP